MKATLGADAVDGAGATVGAGAVGVRCPGKVGVIGWLGVGNADARTLDVVDATGASGTTSPR